MSAGVLVFARMSSTRLPGKALRDFGGLPLLAWVLRRARATGLPVVLATSDAAADAALAELAVAEGAAVYRGALADVLGRAQAAAEAHGLTRIARLCGDRPYFDVDELVAALTQLDGVTAPMLVSNHQPGRTAAGLTTEALNLPALALAAAEACLPDEREHLTLWCYRNAERLRIERIHSAANGDPGRYAVDTEADWRALQPLPGWDPAVPLSTVRAAGLGRQPGA
jgi:spore coat polysaccharide biosynthesis protein SpsF